MILKKTIIFLSLVFSLTIDSTNANTIQENKNILKKPTKYVLNSTALPKKSVKLSDSRKIVTPKEKKASSHVELVSPYHYISKQTKKIPIGLWINLDKGWHSYWKNPGESGKPLKVKWQIPKDFTISTLKWPLPERITFGSLTNFGYKQSFLLISLLLPPEKDITAPVSITAEVEWLICKKVCIPMKTEAQLILPVKDSEKPSPWKGAFEKWSKKLPKTTNKKITLRMKNGGWQADLHTSEKLHLVDVFPLSKNIFSTAPPAILSTSNFQHSVLLKPFLPFHSPSAKNKKVSSLKKTPPEPSLSKALVIFKEKDNKLGFIYTFQKETNMLWFLLLAFLGGLLLNFMPCVLPIVFLKFSNTLEQSGQKKSKIIFGNLLYSAGVTFSFLILAFILLLLKKGGESIGWGFQMQSPYFLLSIIFIFIFMSFNFMGWLSFSLPSVPFLHKGNNLLKHFLTGVLSTTSASPCTAPFMGAAVGYALSGSAVQVIMIFFSLGVGLSFPYLLLSVFPGWIRYIPLPGKWSDKLKHFMAFPMLATSAWLIHLLNQSTAISLLPLLLSLLFIYLGFWLLNNFKKRKWLTWLSRGMIFIAVIYPFAHLYENTKADSPKIVWETFSVEKMKILRAEKKTVFINFTADWCLTCKFNERITFRNQKVIRAFTDRKIHGLKGDWTNKNLEITDVLESYNRSGIPFYLYFPPDSSSGIVLPELLTPGTLLKYIDKNEQQN